MWTTPPSSAMLGLRSLPLLSWHSVHEPEALVTYQTPSLPRSVAMCTWPPPSMASEWVGAKSCLKTRVGDVQLPENALARLVPRSVATSASTSALESRSRTGGRVDACMAPLSRSRAQVSPGPMVLCAGRSGRSSAGCRNRRTRPCRPRSVAFTATERTLALLQFMVHTSLRSVRWARSRSTTATRLPLTKILALPMPGPVRLMQTDGAALEACLDLDRLAVSGLHAGTEGLAHWTTDGRVATRAVGPRSARALVVDGLDPEAVPAIGLEPDVDPLVGVIVRPRPSSTHPCPSCAAACSARHRHRCRRAGTSRSRHRAACCLPSARCGAWPAWDPSAGSGRR